MSMAHQFDGIYSKKTLRRCVDLGPLSCLRVVRGPVPQVEVRDLRHQRVPWLRVIKQRNDGDRTFEMVSTGDHWSFRMSRQIAPEDTVVDLRSKRQCGGLYGYSGGKVIFNWKTPPS